MSRFMFSIIGFLTLLLAAQVHAERTTRKTQHEHLRPADTLVVKNSSSKYNYISANVLYHNLGEEILTFPERRPRSFNVLVATCKTWSADLLVQLHESRKSSSWRFDWKRSLTFATFGFLYIGIVQWFLYVTVLTALFPHALPFSNSPLSAKLKDSAGQLDLAGQILVDNCLFCCFIYFPVFYILKSLMQGGGSVWSRVKAGLNKYSSNIGSDNLCSFAVWVPADVFIFAAPMFLRMPLEHATSFGWTAFMSARRGAADALVKAGETKQALETSDPHQAGESPWDSFRESLAEIESEHESK